MFLQEIKNNIDADFLSLVGEFKLNLIGNYIFSAENYIKIVTYSNENIVFKLKNTEVLVTGKNFKIVEMGLKYTVVKGEICNIEYKG